MQRSKIIQASFVQNVSPAGNFMTTDKMIIALQKNFAPSDDREKLLNFISNIKIQDTEEYTDKGYVQEVSVSQSIGSTLVKNCDVMTQISLIPYVTFPEIEQPALTYFFRLQAKKKDEPLMCAIFCTGSAAWEIETLNRIYDYISGAVSEDITIIR